MFATGVSAGSTSQLLGTNLNPALVIGPKALVFIYSHSIHLNLNAVSHKP